METLFPGVSDTNQISRIFSVLGNLSKDVWPECSKVPDYETISFSKVESPVGLKSRLANRSTDEVSLVRKLLSYGLTKRVSASELLQDKYFSEEPLPCPMSELRFPSMNTSQDDESPGRLHEHMDSYSDFDEFGPVKVTTSKSSSGFSIQLP